MLNTKQTEEVTRRLNSKPWRSLGPANNGYIWIVCGYVNHYVLFDANNKVVDWQTD